jgi:hypothetical protein
MTHDVRMIPGRRVLLLSTQETDLPALLRLWSDVAVWVEPWPNNLAARTLYYSCGLRQTTRPDDLREGPSYWELTRPAWSAMPRLGPEGGTR